MKRKASAWILSAALFVSSVFGSVSASGSQQTDSTIRLPEPVFTLDFDNLSQTAGEKVSGTFLAASGQEVTAHNQVTLAEGKDGSKAVLLDNVAGNSGHLTTPNTQNLNPASLTASCWLKRVSPTKEEGRIFWNKKSASWNTNGWLMGWTELEAMAFVADGQTMAVKAGKPAELMPEGQWVHFASVFDAASGTVTVYRNGMEIASKQQPGAAVTMDPAAGVLQIGQSGYGTEGIGCVLDDARIYGQALSGRQIGELAGLSAQDYLAADAGALSLARRVNADFTLSLQGKYGSSITWESKSDAVVIGEDGQVSVTRGEEDTDVTLTAILSLEGQTLRKEFTVTVQKKSEPVRGLEKLSYDEIIDVNGAIGTRLREAMRVYGMDYLYRQKMGAYLNEYKNHSHSGWSWLEGEQPGKWLESMANCKWMDTDGSIQAAITDVVDQLAASQTKEDKSAEGYNQFGGYLGNGTAAIRKSKPVKGMDPYEMYSTLYGLLNVYSNYREDAPQLAEKSLRCARDLADYLVATIGDEDTKVPYADGTLSNINKVEFWPLAIRNGTTVAGHDVHQGWEGSLLLDPMMRLSQVLVETDAARAARYSQWVDWVIGSLDKWASSWNGHGDTPYADLDKVAAGEMGIDALQHYVHAHTFQMNFLGFLKKYQETGDVAYLDKVTGAWDDITSRQMYITGTVSVGEHYEAGHNLPNTGSVGETCATNSWTLMNYNLFELTREEKYQQIVENVLFNHMFATTTIDGDGYSYHRPLNGTTERFYTGPDCCSSSGMRMQSYIPYYLYAKSDTEVYVNQFVANEVKIHRTGGFMHLKQTTDYPETDDIRIEVLSDSVGGILNIRVPGWVEHPSIKINGASVESSVQAGAYTKLNVSPGDVVDISYPSELTWVKGENSNQGLWAMQKGPMVYCLDAAFLSAEESQQAFGADIARVTASSVFGVEDGKAVSVEGTVEYTQERILGKGYRLKMNTPKGAQTVTVVPYANIGQWYRLGEERPADYNSAVRYSYQIWMPEVAADYPQEPEPEMKPVVHYDFDTADGNVLADVSGNGKNAVGAGQAALEENGKFGKYLKLNGSDAYVRLPEDILYGLYNMTISVWVNPDELGSWARIFDFGGEGTPPHPNLFLTANSGQNNVRLAYEDGDTAQVNGGAALKIGQWQHIAAVIDGSKASLYVDGVKISENAGFQFNPVQTGAMVSNLLGKSNYTADKLFRGGMDDFRIYNRPLSAKEVAMLSEGEEPIKVIQSVGELGAVETTAGTAPVLPERVSVSYDDGTNGREKIAWEDIPKEKYAVPGSFEVKGTVGAFTVSVAVTVKAAEPQKPDGEDTQKPGGEDTQQPIGVEAVRLDRTDAVLEIGTSLVLKAEVWPRQASNQSVTWKSSRPETAQVDSRGKVTAKYPGTAVVTVTSMDGGKQAACAVTVKAPSIRLNYKSLPLQCKKSTSEVKLVSSSVKGDKIKSAKSGSPQIVSAKVKSGKLTIKGMKTGSAVITVTSVNGGSARVKITVKKSVPVEKLSLDKKKITLKKRKKLRLSVTKKPVTATSKIRYRSSDKRIASVTSGGTVTAKKKGNATITAISSNGKKASCKITVK